MKVYVLETGCYSDSMIVGVFSTPEKAMAAHQPIPRAWHSKGHSYTWRDRDEFGDWDFDADWEDAASVQEYEVK